MAETSAASAFPRAGDTRRQWRGLIEEYRDRLPGHEDTPVITLREGGTPLIHSAQLSAATGCDVWLKFEGANPTGSFKDRGMTLAISKAVEAGAKAVICASTGNTSASAAAYAAKSGLVCGVLIPKGKIALGKLAQALVHGATVIQVDGNFDVALDICRTLDEKYPVELVNSVNPFRIQGQKTGAFEVCDFLGRAPDVHVMPVGNAGNITAYWMGYQEYADGRAHRPPSRHARLPGCGLGADRRGAQGGEPLDDRDRDPHRQPRVLGPGGRGRERLGGSIRAVTDRDILRAYRRVASEGVFCEMASAASVAGLLQLSPPVSSSPARRSCAS
jgi:threonine synthase